MTITPSTIAERILETLRTTAQPWDDDELAEALDVAQRQTVNQICRRLAADRRLHRYVGPAGKLVNSLAAPPSANSAVAPAGVRADDSSTTAIPPGSSAEQRAAEVLMIAYLTKELGVELTPRPITTPSGARVEIDGVDDARTVLVEAWAHQGPPKPAQKNKVLADAFKLSWIASTIMPRPRLVLCFSDVAAARPFREGRTWAAAALRDLNIDIIVAALPDDVRTVIRSAQKRQYR
ncbi:hypothetical protein [Amycolatopsis sp. NPDC052450]|uniref:hypothetical protein n=1 Tax=Amycolatopsis sp. NPDC052450 TaxID=3363937 RepID=UPI0037C5F803